MTWSGWSFSEKTSRFFNPRNLTSAIIVFPEIGEKVQIFTFLVSLFDLFIYLTFFAFLENWKQFCQFFENYKPTLNFFNWVEKRIVFEKIGRHLAKNHKFCRKSLVFLGIEKYQLVHEYQKLSENMADSGFPTHYLWLSNCSDRQKFALINVLAVSGKGKKCRVLNWIISFRKFLFDGKKRFKFCIAPSSASSKLKSAKVFLGGFLSAAH